MNSLFQNVIREWLSSDIDFETICFQMEESEELSQPESYGSLPVQPMVTTSVQDDANEIPKPFAITMVAELVILVRTKYLVNFVCVLAHGIFHT